MSLFTLMIRLEDRPAALERLLGRLRSRLRGTPRISMSQEDDGTLQLLVPVGREAGSRTQLRAEIGELRDVRSVDELPAETARQGRELAVARLRDLSEGEDPAEGRLVSRSGNDRIVEVTGTVDEVDRILGRWREAGIMAGSVRTGRVVVPEAPEPGPERPKNGPPP